MVIISGTLGARTRTTHDDCMVENVLVFSLLYKHVSGGYAVRNNAQHIQWPGC